MLWIGDITWTISDQIIVSETQCGSSGEHHSRPRSSQNAFLTIRRVRIPVVSGTPLLADARCLTVLTRWCRDLYTLLPRNRTAIFSVCELSERRSALCRQTVTINRRLNCKLGATENQYKSIKWLDFIKRHTDKIRYDTIWHAISTCDWIMAEWNDCLPQDQQKIKKETSIDEFGVHVSHKSQRNRFFFLFHDLAEKTKNPAKILVKTYDGPLWRSHYETMSPELVFRRTFLCHVRVMAWAVRLSSLCRLWRSCAGYKIDTM